MVDGELEPKRAEAPSGCDIGVADKVAFLSRPAAYPEPCKRVETVETHMSWVFLTERFAYKLKKPVRYDFLDFRSLEARRRSCEEEVRLNRRLAPEVYLGVVPVTRTPGGGLRLGGFAEPVEWLVKMHRLPGARMLDRVIADGTLTMPHVRGLALYLAEFYRNAPPVPITAEAYHARLQAEIAANLEHLSDPAYGLPNDLVVRLCRAQSDFLASHHALFDHRASDRRIVEAHGDLRPEHVCLGPRPQIIDCLEFKRAFRILDPADELSFLSLECIRLGAPEVEAQLFEVYREVTEDAPSAELIAFYKCHRACLRAKIAVWHLREPQPRTPEKWPELGRTYLALAEAEAAKLT